MQQYSQAQVICFQTENTTQRLGLQFGQKVLWIANSEQADFEEWRRFAEDLADVWNSSENVPYRPAVRSGMPSSPEAAVTLGANGGIPPEFCEMIFHQCNARGFVDGNGVPLRDFRSFLQYQWSRQSSDWLAKRKPSPALPECQTVRSNTPWEIQQRIDAIKSELRSIAESATPALHGGVLDYGRFRDKDGALLPKYKSYRDSLIKERDKLTALLRGVARPD